jgi:hypothetical protein|nr:MAG TPA: hypothetical protein [Caudoviricetes sp.]
MEYITYDGKKLQSFDYECSLNTGGNILGSCELGKATLQMINESNEYSSFKGKWISTPKGSFYIYNVEPVQEKVNIKLECYDVKYKLDTLYVSSKHSFPCTLKEWRNSIFDECELIYDNSDFPNSDLVLQTEPYVESGASNRQVISMIAQAGASFVITDENDKFYFNWFTNTVHEITDWTELTTEKETSKAINCVVLGREGGDDYTYPIEQPNTPVMLRINNNYILDPQDTESTTDLRSTTIVPIYERVNNFSFIKYSIKSEFVNNKLLIKLGDKVKYVDIWGNSLVSLVMSIKLSWLGNDWENSENYSVYLSADEISETSEDFDYSKNTKEKLLEVERKTDKNAGKIEDTIKSVNDLEEKNANFTIEMDKISTSVSETTTKLTETDNKISDVNNKLNDYATVESVKTISNRVEENITATEKNTEIITKIEENGVTKVDTKTGFTMDAAGFHVDKSGAPTSSIVDETGMEVVDKTTNETIQFTGYVDDAMSSKVPMLNDFLNQTVSYSKSLLFSQFLRSNNFRIEEIEDETHGKGLGIFYVGGD